MSDLATIGVKADTSDLSKLQTELGKTAAAGGKVDKSLDGAEKSMKKMDKAAKDASKSMGQNSRKIGMASVQVEQFVGSVQGGQDALRAFSFQATDLGIVLGAPLVGVIVGLSAAIIGPLYTALTGSSDLVEDFTVDIDELTSSIGKLSELSAAQSAVAIIDITKNLNDLSKEAGESGDKITELSKKIDSGFASTSGRRQVKLTREELKELNEELLREKANLDKINQTSEASRSALVQLTSGIDISKKALDGHATSLESVSKSLEAQIIAMRDGAEASLEYNVAQTLGLKAGEEIPPNIQAQIDMITLLTKKKKEASEADKLIAEMRKEELINERELDALINKVDDFGGAWTRTGNAMIDAFGDTVDILADYEKRMSRIADLQDDLNEERKGYADGTEDAIKIDSELAELNEESLKAQVGGYAQLAGAVGDYFDEKTAASRAALALEQTLTAIELVLTAKKTAAKVAEGAAAMFAALGPFGFAAVAGMVAVMASFGFSGGGGGSSGSTGTVLGGGESQSTANSGERLEEIMVAQLGELRGIRGELSGVQQQSQGLLSDLFKVDFGFREIKDRTENLLENSFDAMNDVFFKDGKAPFQGALEGIFNSVEATIGESVSSLGLSVKGGLSDFVFSVGNISFDELDADAAQERLDNIISHQSDLLTEQMIPSIMQFQKAGEGAFETLVRVSQEQAVFNDALDIMGMSLSNVGAIMQIEVAQAVIELTGGLESFSDLIGEFFDEFLSEEEQFSHITKSLTEAFGSLGLSMFDSRDSFKDYITGLDLTDEAQQRLYAGLLELVPALDEYYDTIEDRQQEALDAELELIEEAKNARLTALYTEQSMLQSVVSKFLPSAQSTAITAEAALAAARSGDFTLANQLTPTAVSSSNYGSSTEFALAQARQAAVLAEIGQLAELELTDTEYEISLLETQNDILEEINANIINQALIGGESNQATQTASVAQSSEQMAATQEEVKYMTESMTRNISEMRNDINQIKNNGLSVFTLGDDVVATTSV